MKAPPSEAGDSERFDAFNSDLRSKGENEAALSVLRETRSSALLAAVVRDNIIPFFGRGSGDERDDGFRVAHVEDFVRHTGLDVNEIAGLVLQHLLEPGSELVTHFSFEDIKDQLEADVNMGGRDAAGRYRGDIG
jgi:hypothetical protein